MNTDLEYLSPVSLEATETRSGLISEREIKREGLHSFYNDCFLGEAHNHDLSVNSEALREVFFLGHGRTANYIRPATYDTRPTTHYPPQTTSYFLSPLTSDYNQIIILIIIN